MIASELDQPFVFNSLPARVVFGEGRFAELRDEARALGISRALVLTTPAQVELGRDAAKKLGSLFAGHFQRAEMHTPVSVTEEALLYLKETGADGLVAVGGGSTIGLAKAVSLRRRLPK
ncbi:MAG: iron-containing alcohol dehydrogenase, partial [Rhizobiaceae bacterium]|nr:iron-containing alcohol dehydrogenase [Rhizobiaceae bacterium]